MDGPRPDSWNLGGGTQRETASASAKRDLVCWLAVADNAMIVGGATRAGTSRGSSIKL